MFEKMNELAVNGSEIVTPGLVFPGIDKALVISPSGPLTRLYVVYDLREGHGFDSRLQERCSPGFWRDSLFANASYLSESLYHLSMDFERVLHPSEMEGALSEEIPVGEVLARGDAELIAGASEGGGVETVLRFYGRRKGEADRIVLGRTFSEGLEGLNRIYFRRRA